MLLLDPDGKVLQTAAADPVTYPQRSLRIGSVPVEGWYTIRVKGVGLPLGSSWNVKIEVAYAAATSARNKADGHADPTPAMLSSGGHNVTLPLAGLTVWAPSDLTPKMDNLDGARYALSVFGPNGTLAYASGLRSGKASFSAPEPGAYRAFVYAEPPTPGAPFSPFVRAFAFDVGANRTTVAQKFSIEDTVAVPQSPTGNVVAIYAFPAGPAAKVDIQSDRPGVTLTQSLKDGNATKLLTVDAQNPGPAATAVVKASVEFATAQALVGPSSAKGEPAGRGVPAAGAALVVLALAGAAAVGVAIFWRRDG
jgi:hypothetical protein